VHEPTLGGGSIGESGGAASVIVDRPGILASTMCDSLCVLTPEGTIFAKNSDRPPGELQLPEAHRQRPAGGRLHTQYLDIADEGAYDVLLSRPGWLWGAEHGVNEHGVAIGNEKVDTRSGVDHAPPALIGMDLVRLGLERARGADQAVEVMTDLLERHGQGGIADTANTVAYDSSFLVADSSSAWVLETAGRTWAAEPVEADGVAISNRLTIRGDWTRASADVPAGADFDRWRDPGVDTAHADVRLAASRTFLRGDQSGAATNAAGRTLDPRHVVGHLRDHGTGPWGEPATMSSSTDAATAVPPPSHVRADGTGVTICMHARRYMATTASMVAYLPRPGTGPLRSWVAAGSPCVSVYVPLFGVPDLTPGMLDDRLWQAGADLRRRVEQDGDELFSVRERLDPIEVELWTEADELVDQPDRWDRFHLEAWRRVRAAIDRLIDRA
jgi:secernin